MNNLLNVSNHIQYYFASLKLSNYNILGKKPFNFNQVTRNQDDLVFLSSPYNNNALNEKMLFTLQENNSDYRNQRLQNPIFRYDFKLGNYMPEENKKRSPFLFTTMHDLTTGIRKPS
jgi:hypothetical protein